ncbi:VOC family protein [Flagellimonas sp. S174]|uniref:VOC family protein n=1 Tax=Flagellimonas sp. S174 TaxID=3410790 RepID=UPI003BF4949F
MEQNIGLLTLVVSEYDEAIEFYTQKMGLDLIEDTVLSEDKRWVVVKPKGSKGSGLLLAKAANTVQEKSIGNQTGGRVFLFLNTDDFWRDYKIMIAKGVNFLEEPRKEAYGIVSVFEDLYGNKWDLLELKK